MTVVITGGAGFLGQRLAARILADGHLALPDGTEILRPRIMLADRPGAVLQPGLEGKVTLVDFWTFGCWNCYRSFPWLKQLEARLADRDFRVIGIHSPEFEHERDSARVKEKVREFGLRHPVMLDNDFAFWRALDNRYWPAFYLVDKLGVIRHLHVGETHAGTARARRIEEQLRALLDE